MKKQYMVKLKKDGSINMVCNVTNTIYDDKEFRGWVLVESEGREDLHEMFEKGEINGIFISPSGKQVATRTVNDLMFRKFKYIKPGE